jgi:hypothetical protein
MSALPAQSWNSEVKVINNNKYEITVYANVVNFAPQGEAGEGKFLPVFEKTTEGTTLAEWIKIDSEPFIIKPESSVSIPFSVTVPENASPGGHFAAILVGTKPPKTSGVIKVTTSQVVTSLFFVKIAGDIVEDAAIREFSTEQTFSDKPEMQFSVRFENKGNVHVQPQGEIVITNMWGKERGVIPINHQTHFGNVLPMSVREFEFAWKGEKSLVDIGRYKATVTLGYGSENKRFETRSTYFYIIPFKGLFTVLSAFIFIVLLIRWSIRLYVRKMLALAGIDTYSKNLRQQAKSSIHDNDVRITKRNNLTAPLRNGFVDFISSWNRVPALKEKLLVLPLFMFRYKNFSLGVILFLIAALLIGFFVKQIFVSVRDYEIIIDNPGSEMRLSSEEILYEKNKNQATTSVFNAITPKNEYSIIIVNSSDKTGIGADLQIRLESEGFSIDDLLSDFEEVKEKTVIVYDPTLQEEAVYFSKLLNGALLSAVPEATSTTSPTISIYLGNDYSKQ